MSSTRIALCIVPALVAFLIILTVSWPDAPTEQLSSPRPNKNQNTIRVERIKEGETATLAMRAPKSESDGSLRIPAWMDAALGIGVCASTSFVAWVDDETSLGRRPLVRLLDPTCLGKVKYRPCTSRPTSSSAPPFRAAPQATNSRVDRQDSVFEIDAKPSDFCFVFQCSTACHSSLKSKGEGARQRRGINVEEGHDDCSLLGQRNVLLRYPMPTSASTQLASTRAPNVLVLLVDSVSWEGFDSHFPATRGLLEQWRAVASDDCSRVAFYRDSNAIGAQSATNHPPVLCGKLPAKCAAFKAKKEGVPSKKDGELYAAYKKLRQKIISNETTKSEFLRSHLLKVAKDRGYHTAALYPIPYTAVEATCLGVEAEKDMVPEYADVFQWNFFNEAVHMQNRALKESQGCIGDRPSMDYVDQFVEKLFAASLSVPVFGLVAEQTPHQQRWDTGAIQYFDLRVAQLLHRMHARGLLKNTVVVFTADHGLGYKKDTRSEIVALLDAIAHPVLAWILPPKSVDERQEQKYQAILGNARRQARVSHFDTYATVADILGGGQHENLGVNTVATSLASGEWPEKGLKRSCAEMGIFQHSCRYFEEVVYVNGSVRALSAAHLDDIGGQILSSFSRLLSPKLNGICLNWGSLMSSSVDVFSMKLKTFPDGSSYLVIVVDISHEGKCHRFKVTTKPSKGKGLPATVQVANVVRISAYAMDEAICGAAVKKLAAEADMQLCVCAAASSVPGSLGKGFFGG